ncbi:DNA-3-methyladenine glycosylase family protein [Acetobacter oeni]|uniref:DNA-3-methyladenine glycosylase II n=1 Tax=Acetobacter oeni TaxID=304077 RepID=A0A511XN18_9PROT|nr:DNA-3-methyladenine glycosylase [Acetobacter oeni]MBB3881600.1 DNA-3-methyladenine glycosylase II [Acetobacter oeni]NHO17586.1 DNA-3-methyladenine glycosylase 2 family protein [Acetobacter oeni]GBR04926.1 DNA-3-methyladenine glycosylase [Acetobacter oeni LMG 21952]GEN64340.1 DNA-3-methyladenine glycosylase 1 [Acetobacter oeni]
MKKKNGNNKKQPNTIVLPPEPAHATVLHPAEPFLAAADPDFAELIRRVGPCRLEPDHTGEPYEALIRAVLYQQLHGRAAAAIFGRLKALSDGRCPSPEDLLTYSFEALRGCGLSARKIATVQAVAEASLNGVVPARAKAESMETEDLIARITSLRGIGRWTVEMLLIFTLGKPDIMPVDDFGVSEGWRKLKGLETRLRPRQLGEATLCLAPWRSAAAWYLWRAAAEGKTTGTGNPVTG